MHPEVRITHSLTDNAGGAHLKKISYWCQIKTYNFKQLELYTGKHYAN